MKLISTTDFVLLQTELYKEDKISVFDFALRVKNHAQFLKKPLTLGMFVPCDDAGNILDEPINYDVWESNFVNDENSILGFTEHEKFYKAKERVLFKIINPRLINKNLFLYESYIYYSEGLIYENNDGRSLELIQDLISFTDLTLTQTAIKQIGL